MNLGKNILKKSKLITLNLLQNTARAARNLKKTVLVKKFPRFEDPFCLGKQEKARSLRFPNNENQTSQGELSGRDNIVKSFSDPNTPKVYYAKTNG